MPIALAPGTGAIINKPNNVHWIAQIKNRDGVIETYDSYNRKMGQNPVKAPEYFVQKGKQQDCGSRSLAWLIHRL